MGTSYVKQAEKLASREDKPVPKPSGDFGNMGTEIGDPDAGKSARVWPLPFPPAAEVDGSVCSMSSASAREISDQDVSTWLGYTDEHEADSPLVPGWSEFARKELGQRMVGRVSLAEFFSRRLFIDLCCRVADAYLAATIPEECLGETYGDAKSVRDQLGSIARSAAELRENLAGLDRTGFALLSYDYSNNRRRQTCWRDGMIHSLEDLLEALSSDASSGANAADSMVRPGTPQAPLSHLIRQVSDVVAMHGLEVNAKPSGPLHALCSLVLEVPAYKAAFGDPQSLRGSIRSVLDHAGCETSPSFLAGMFRP